MKKLSKKLIHEGNYAAKVPVELVVDDTGWSPYLTMEDALKLETLRTVLREGDVAGAAKYAQVFELRAIAG